MAVRSSGSTFGSEAPSAGDRRGELAGGVPAAGGLAGEHARHVLQEEVHRRERVVLSGGVGSVGAEGAHGSIVGAATSAVPRSSADAQRWSPRSCSATPIASVADMTRKVPSPEVPGSGWRRPASRPERSNTMPPASDAPEGGGSASAATVKCSGVGGVGEVDQLPDAGVGTSRWPTAAPWCGRPCPRCTRRRASPTDGTPDATETGTPPGGLHLQHGEIGLLVAGHHGTPAACRRRRSGPRPRRRHPGTARRRGGDPRRRSPGRWTGWNARRRPPSRARPTGRHVPAATVEVVALAGSSMEPITRPDSSRPTPPSTTPEAINVERRRSTRPRGRQADLARVLPRTAALQRSLVGPVAPRSGRGHRSWRRRYRPTRLHGSRPSGRRGGASARIFPTMCPVSNLVYLLIAIGLELHRPGDPVGAQPAVGDVAPILGRGVPPQDERAGTRRSGGSSARSRSLSWHATWRSTWVRPTRWCTRGVRASC